MLLTLFLTCFVSLAAATVLLLAFGDRLRVANRFLGLAVGVVLAVGAGEAAARLWRLDPMPVLAAEALLVVVAALVVAARPLWNPVGQVFLASFAAAALAYLAFAADVTFAGGLSPAGVAASALLLVLEASALLLSGSFAFESCDVLCRVRWARPQPRFDPDYRPKVSLHVPAYNEPPDMLIETIRSLDRLDYPNYEIVVLDHNTRDPAVWQPVARWSEPRRRVRFVHVEHLPGYKSGALNLALRLYTDPAAELVGRQAAGGRDADRIRRLHRHRAPPGPGPAGAVGRGGPPGGGGRGRRAGGVLAARALVHRLPHPRHCGAGPAGRPDGGPARRWEPQHTDAGDRCSRDRAAGVGVQRPGRLAGAQPRRPGALATEQAALRRVATLVARGVSPDALSARVAEEVGPLLGADMTTIVRFGPGDRAELVAAAGETTDLLPVGTTWDLTGRGRSPRCGRPAARPGSTGSSRPPAPPAISRVEPASAPRSPARSSSRDAAGGAMVVLSRTERLPPGTEGRMADFTELVAVAVADAEARAQLRRIAEEQSALRRVATLVAQAGSPSLVFGAVTREVGLPDPGRRAPVGGDRGLDQS